MVIPAERVGMADVEKLCKISTSPCLTTTLLALHYYFTSTSLRLYYNFTNTSLLLYYYYFTTTLLILCYHFTSTLPLLYQYFTTTLPIFFLGECPLELAQGPSRVALAWHKARGSTPFGVTKTRCREVGT